ncbi:hypothetical protein N7495_009335 [Penicillium taxi]|uniref:uncharacterized protein n=1 Tax=Penicillium taxi TaxID=168475 RepID=UPI00254576E1|nr:uncharacterized protein N7495_009335 [Penicillium taxi]KAJ5884825.1 hypothetical protein N7495_009335 [Penicillium taxi]
MGRRTLLFKLPGILPDAPRIKTLSPQGNCCTPRTMDFAEQRLSRKRDSRTRAPTACQTCRLRKTRCDNVRPICSYCAHQGVDCSYPESSPRSSQPSYDFANQEIIQRLGHIASLLEDIKQDNGASTVSSTRSLKTSFFELAVNSTSPQGDTLSGSTLPGSNISIENGPSEHDPLTLYTANSPECMLRWPIYNQVITNAERIARSYLLDSLDAQDEQYMPSPRQTPLLDNIQDLCQKYFLLVHMRNPIVDTEKLTRYAREVTIRGLGWDGPSCQVLLACALAACASSFPPHEVPEDLDRMNPPPIFDASLERAEAYFHAAKQRFGFLHTSPTDIQCFLLAGAYHRHALRPLQAWFCFQQASCRLEVRLRSSCRDQWTADVNYHNLESRLYWSCIQAEHEMQSELPLWSSGLESLGYSDPFPTFSKSSPTTPDNMDGFNESFLNQITGSNEEKSWRFYIGSICNRRTVNEMLIDIWREGERGWVSNIGGTLERTSGAVKVVASWLQTCLAGVSSAGTVDPDIEHFLRGRYHISLEKIYRPALYLALHYTSLPSYVHNNMELSREIFDQGQKAINNCAQLIPRLFYQFRHEWIWNVLRCTFAAAIQILGAVLSNVHCVRGHSGLMLYPPLNWPALVRVSIRTLKLWSTNTADVTIMASTLERLYNGTCQLAGIRTT